MKTKIKIYSTLFFLAGMLSIIYVAPAIAQYTPDEFTAGLWHLDNEFGLALDFDANDYVAVPDSAILEPSNVTVEAWVKRLGSPGTYRYIVNKQYVSGWASYGLYTGPSGGLWFYIGTISTFYRSPDAGAGVWDGNWHHIAGTFDGSYVRLYVDGSEVGTGTAVPIGTSIAYDGAGVNIGGPADSYVGGPYHFDGIIDEVRISSVARTSFELSKPLTVDSDTVALWHFDEGSGQIVDDATGNGNVGRLGSTSGDDENDPTWINSTVLTALALDSSFNENHGTIYGASFVDGVFDQALAFDGVDDYINIPDDSSLDITGDITLEARFKIKEFSTSEGYHMYILSKDTTAQRSYGIGVDLTWKYPNRPFFIVFDGTTWKVAWGPELETDTWYHMRGVFFASTGDLWLYLNGVLESTEPSTITSIYSGTADLRIGARQYPDHRCFFNGTIDEVRISNVAKNVDIDIKPGSYPNSINLGSGGNVPVAIFSTLFFNATAVDPNSVTLAGASVRLKGKGTPMASFEDVNEDGLLDIVVHVDTTTFELTGTDTEAVLEGWTFGGAFFIRGVDTVRIVKE